MAENEQQSEDPAATQSVTSQASSTHHLDSPRVALVIGLLGTWAVGVAMIDHRLFMPGLVICYLSAVVTIYRCWKDFIKIRSLHWKTKAFWELLFIAGLILCEVLGSTWLAIDRFAGVSEESVQEQHHALGPLKSSLPGVGVASVIQIDNLPEMRRRYVFELTNKMNARASLYLSSSGVFTFSVSDPNGDEYDLQVPQGIDGLPLGEGVLVFAEAGSASNYSFLRLYLNGKLLGERVFEFPINIGQGNWSGVLGANISSAQGSAFQLSGLVIYTETLTDQQEIDLTNSMERTLGIQP